MSSSAPFLLVTFVCSSGWTSRIFSPAQFERALPQLKGLDFPLLVSEYHPDDVCLWESCPYCGLLLLHPAAPCDSAPADTCPIALEFLTLDRSGLPRGAV